MKTRFFGLAFLLMGVISGWLYFYFSYPTTSPFKATSYLVYSLRNPHKKMSQETVGFLPYWRLDDAQYLRFDLLSEVSYFSLTVDGEGNFIKVVNNETEPGWREWEGKLIKDLIAKTQLSGGKFNLTVLVSNNQTIESFLNDRHAQVKFINNLHQEIKSRHLDGITLDFEYVGKPDAKYRSSFTDFAGKFCSSVREENPKTNINLTLLPLSGRDQGLFDLPRLSAIFDRFIGMSYDYYGASSDIAGPIAPMQGFGQNKFFFDVATTYQDYQKAIPKEKILMGIPYYGWDWAVKDGKKIQSQTLPKNDPGNYAAVLSYARAKENKDLEASQCQWDDYAQEPWCWYTDKNKIDHQVWFENNRSIKIKYEFSRKMEFAGVAIWSLGYDKSYPDLWDIMETTFKQ